MTPTRDFDQLASLAGWDLAKELGCEFSGDCNFIDHDGYFYDARDWDHYGYASCVAFSRIPEHGTHWMDADNTLHVEACTINRPDSVTERAECLASCGWRYEGEGEDLSIVDVGNHTNCGNVIADDPVVIRRVEIEACKRHWGAEVQEDFGGPYVRRFDGETDDAAILAEVIGWLEGLAS